MRVWLLAFRVTRGSERVAGGVDPFPARRPAPFARFLRSARGCSTMAGRGAAISVRLPVTGEEHSLTVGLHTPLSIFRGQLAALTGILVRVALLRAVSRAVAPASRAGCARLGRPRVAPRGFASKEALRRSGAPLPRAQPHFQVLQLLDLRPAEARDFRDPENVLFEDTGARAFCTLGQLGVCDGATLQLHSLAPPTPGRALPDAAEQARGARTRRVAATASHALTWRGPRPLRTPQRRRRRRPRHSCAPWRRRRPASSTRAWRRATQTTHSVRPPSQCFAFTRLYG
jgi:hypothetical protein